MNLVSRVQEILLRPKPTWPLIEAESTDTAALYKNYVAVLALIPAVAGFIGMSLVGVSALGMSFRVPIVTGLVMLVVSYVLSLVMVYLIGLIVDALAPSFGGTRNPLLAQKLSAYASTAFFVGGVFSLLPALSVLGLLVGLYSVYLIYTGLPVLMKCPPEKSVAYTAVVAVAAIVVAVVISVVLGLFAPSPMRVGAAGGPAVSIRTPDAAVDIDIDAAKIEALAKRMEEAGRQMEQAQVSGDAVAAGQVAAAMAAAMGGDGRQPFEAQQLKALLPETVAGLPRISVEAQSASAMGMAASHASAVYRADDGRQIEISLVDSHGLGGLASVAAWADITVDREVDGQVEKVYREDQRTVREDYATDHSHGEYMLVLGNGVMINARAEQMDMDAVRAAVSALEPSRIEAMVRSSP